MLLAGIAALALLPVAATAAALANAAKPRTFTREDFGVLVANPNSYKGARVDISGKIFAPPQIASGNSAVMLQAYMDPKNSTWTTIVRYEHPGLRVRQGDYIHIVGTVRGEVTSKTASGVTVNGVSIVATSAKKTDATAAASPSVRVAVTSQPATQNGVTVLITEVEFATDETRAFVTIANDTRADVSYSSTNAKAAQGSQQFDTIPSDYRQIASDIKAGVTSSGVVVFGPLDPRLAAHLVFQLSQGSPGQLVAYSFDIAGGE